MTEQKQPLDLNETTEIEELEQIIAPGGGASFID
jgi:hypothetical protein